MNKKLISVPLCAYFFDKVHPISLSVVVFIASLAALSPAESVDEVLHFGRTVCINVNTLTYKVISRMMTKVMLIIFYVVICLTVI